MRIERRIGTLFKQADELQCAYFQLYNRTIASSSLVGLTMILVLARSPAAGLLQLEKRLAAYMKPFEAEERLRRAGQRPNGRYEEGIGLCRSIRQMLGEIKENLPRTINETLTLKVYYQGA